MLLESIITLALSISQKPHTIAHGQLDKSAILTQRNCRYELLKHLRTVVLKFDKVLLKITNEKLVSRVRISSINYAAQHSLTGLRHVCSGRCTS